MCESHDCVWFNGWTNLPRTCQNWFQVCCNRYIPFLVLKYLHKFHVQLQTCKCTPKGSIQCYINLEKLIGLTFFTINGFKLLLIGGLSMFFGHFLISYCARCNINLLDLV
jgi:hypothetical protein